MLSCNASGKGRRGPGIFRILLASRWMEKKRERERLIYLYQLIAIITITT